MIFIFDENFSYKIAAGLRAVYDTNVYEIKHLAHDMGFGGVPDVEWLPQLPSNQQSILLTKDYHIERRPHERQAWKQAGLITFFFRKGWFPAIDDQAWMLFRWWPKIVGTAERAKTGDVYLVPFRGAPKNLKTQ